MDKKQIGRKFLDIYGKVGVYFLLFIVILTIKTYFSYKKRPYSLNTN